MKKLFTLATLFGQFTVAAPAILDGTYAMKLKIGDNIFNDVVTLKAEDSHSVITVKSYSDGMVGELTVPGIFTSPLAGQVFCNFYQSSCKLSFAITANENRQSYKVFYEGSVEDQDYYLVLRNKVKPHFSGQATLQDGSLLGTFEAELVNP